MPGKKVAVTDFRKKHNGEGTEVEISFQNQSDDLFYDFVNFYSGKKNLDTELLEIEPGEIKNVTLKASDLEGRFKISKDNTESGVIFREGEKSEQEEKSPKRGEEETLNTDKQNEGGESSDDGNLFDKVMEGEKEPPELDLAEKVPDLSETVEEMKEEKPDMVKSSENKEASRQESKEKNCGKDDNILQNLIEKVPGIAKVEDVKEEAIEDFEEIEDEALEDLEGLKPRPDEEKVKEKQKEGTEEAQIESEDKEEETGSADEDKESQKNSLFTRLRHPFNHPKPEQESEEEASEQEGEDEEDEMLVTEKNNYSTERVTTGVINLDNKIEGGFVEGTMNLITGKTGTGKTAFCSNFILEGAKKGEPGVYVTTEEREEDILEDINAMFGWDFDSLAEQDKVRVLSIKPVFPSQSMDNISRIVRSYISELLDEVNDAIEEIDAERVVIDSVSLVQMFIQDQYMSRVALSSLMNNLREAGVTAVLVGSIPETSEGLSKEGIIEYLVDTVILLEFVPVAEDYNRTLKIRKMRRTDHETDIFPFEVTADGLKVHEAYESL